MVQCDKSVRRIGDGPNKESLEVIIIHDGDAFVRIKDSRGNMIAQVEFCGRGSGNYHQGTIKALYKLAIAMEKDNKYPNCPNRYK